MRRGDDRRARRRVRDPSEASLLEADGELASGKRQRVDTSCSSGSGGDAAAAAAAGPSDFGPLPPGWVEAKDPRYNNATYWYNKETRQTSWTRPAAQPVTAQVPQAAANGQHHGGYAQQGSCSHGYGQQQNGYGHQAGYGQGQGVAAPLLH